MPHLIRHVAQEWRLSPLPVLGAPHVGHTAVVLGTHGVCHGHQPVKLSTPPETGETRLGRDSTHEGELRCMSMGSGHQPVQVTASPEPGRCRYTCMGLQEVEKLVCMHGGGMHDHRALKTARSVALHEERGGPPSPPYPPCSPGQQVFMPEVGAVQGAAVCTQAKRKNRPRVVRQGKECEKSVLRREPPSEFLSPVSGTMMLARTPA